MFRRLAFLLASLPLLSMTSGESVRVPYTNNWLQFAGPDRVNRRTAITAKNIKRLVVAWRVVLPEISDGSPVYLSGVLTPDGLRNLLIAETTAGRLVALNAKNGLVVWQTNPPPGPRWTTSSPAVDGQRRYVFAYALDGHVHRYDVASGREVAGPGWPALITMKGDVEKGSSNISIATTRDGHTYLYMPAAGYPDPGDEGDYQGHLVAIDIDSGEQHVFNALCSDRATHLGYGDCATLRAGIWARAGAVYDSATDRIFVTTGNGSYNADGGGFDWGSSVVALHPNGSADSGTPIDSYTPVDHQTLTDQDLDLSSTTIEPLPVAGRRDWPRLGVQSGKDGRIRLLNLEDLSGQGGPRHLGGEIQVLDVPQGGGVFTQPLAWLDAATQRSWLFVTNFRGIAAFELVKSASDQPELVLRWTRDGGGTTPILINRVLYVASPHALVALRPTTGELLWSDQSIGDIHWQSPIVVNDTVYLADEGGTITAYSIANGS
jgi:outer membrane protein assembly factor BamB